MQLPTTSSVNELQIGNVKELPQEMVWTRTHTSPKTASTPRGQRSACTKIQAPCTNALDGVMIKQLRIKLIRSEPSKH